ncbi:hypothetical protein [Vibrio proteolyticus]|nr:hypothetical protein [Vibrio proteolyticus]
MINQMLWLKILLLSLGILCSMATEAKPIYVVSANTQWPELTKHQTKMLYRGKVTRVQNQKVVLCDLPVDSPTRIHFYRQLLRKSPTQMYTQWASLAFSGKVQPPIQLSEYSEQAVLSWLFNHPNGIAYFDFAVVPESLNVLYTLELE